MTEDSIQRILEAIARNDANIDGLKESVSEVKATLVTVSNKADERQEQRNKHDLDVHGRLSRLEEQQRQMKLTLERGTTAVEENSMQNALERGREQQHRQGVDQSLKVFGALVGGATVFLTIVALIWTNWKG